MFSANSSSHSVSPHKRLAVAIMLAASGVNAPIVLAKSTSENTNVSSPYQQAYNITAQPLLDALIEFGQQVGLQVSVEDTLVNGKRSSEVQGNMTVQQALNSLLAGTGLTHQINGHMLTLVAMDSDVKTLDTMRVVGETEAERRFGEAPVEPGGFKAEYQATATKMAMSLKETPQAISVVTRESMDARQVKDVATAIELTAGVSGTNRAAPSMFGGRGYFGQSYSIRGQEPNYYRGLRSDGFAVSVLSQFDLAAYERVEVIKGPSGFYGQGSLGGFINLVRKKPKAEFEASISGQVGSYDTYRTEADITGALTDNKKVRGRMITAYEDAGAFTDGLETQTTMLAPSIEADIGEHTRVLLQLLYQKENYIPSNGMPMKREGDELIPFDVSRSFLFGAVGDDESDSMIADATLRIDHELSERWLASLLLQSNKTEQYIIINNGVFSRFATGSLHDTEVDAWAGELRLDGKFDAFGREHKLILGIEQNRMNTDVIGGLGLIGSVDIYTENFADAGFLSADEIPISQDESSVTKNRAIYAQTALNLHERTQLLISARYDWADLDSTSLNGEDHLEKSELTMRVGLTQEFTDNISAYAIYAESFNPVRQTSQSGNILEPETGVGYELGLKTDWLDNKLGATLAVYRQELDNRAIPDPEDLTNTYSISAGLHQAEGIELEITGSPFPSLTLAAAANWSDNEFVDNDDPNHGLSNYGSIDEQYSLYANYKLQKGPLKGLGVGATLVSVGDREYIRSAEQVYIDGYERVDLNFSYSGLPNLDMNLLVRNVFDEKYVERAQSGISAWTYWGSPRAILFKATYHFN